MTLYQIGDKVRIAHYADFLEFNDEPDGNPFTNAPGSDAVVSDVIADIFFYMVTVEGISEPVPVYADEIYRIEAAR